MALNRPRGKEFTSALALSVVFTIAFFYLTFEVPIFLDKVFRQYFPEVFYDVEAIEKVLSTLRPIGYLALAITIALILLGFMIRRGALVFLGSLALYIPTFGYFAYAMFFLTGLGVLRVLWLPMLELSPLILKLGCVVYLPFSVIPYASLIGMAITLIGLFIFLLGVTTWLYGKFKNYELINFWIYKYSRHPQYLGFILWSYGLLIFVSHKTYIRGAFTTPPAFIWLVSTMITIGVALLEELKLIRMHGVRYEEYLKRTPFMIPLPKPLSRIMAIPMRIIGGYPRNTKDIIVVISLYAFILIILSYALMLVLES